MNKHINFLIKLLQKEPKLFMEEILNYTDNRILIFLTYLFSTDIDIFNLLITFIGQNEDYTHILQMLLRILRNNNMEIYKYILLMHIPYILNNYINNNNNNIVYLLNNLILYDILLLNCLEFIYYENNFDKFSNLLKTTEELEEYKKILNYIMIKNESYLRFDICLLEENEEIFFYESNKKNKILKMSNFKKLLKKDNTIFINGNSMIMMNENLCDTKKYKKLFLVDDFINNSIINKNKIINKFNIVVILEKQDYKTLFPIYLDNKINIINYNNIFFLSLEKYDIKTFLNVIENKFCNNNDIILSNKHNKFIDNIQNNNINVIKLKSMNKLLKYLVNYKKL